jgi:hypothetical protein
MNFETRAIAASNMMLARKPRRKRTHVGARRKLIVAICVFLSACATWTNHGITAAAPEPLRIAVLPVQDTAGIAALSDIETVTAKPQEQAEAGLVKARMATVAADITSALETRLSASPDFEVIPAAQVRRAIAALSLPPGAAPPPAQAQQLGAALNAQALLHVELAGYGKLKHSWLAFLIGTGMVEAVVQGVVVARATSSSAAGLAVGLEEALQELLTWGGGAYVIQRHFVPVILRGQLISSADGEVVWSDTAIDTLDRSALDKLPPDKRDDRETQLRLTTTRAVNELTADLEKKAKQELGRGHGNAPFAVPLT